jgi:PAS domain-containing protein
LPLAARILIPPLLSIGLFVIVIYFIFLPALENRIVATKRQMLRELVETAWRTLDVYHAQETAGRLTRAQARAVAHLRGQRYGPEKKDYFWITDLRTRMVMHPYLTRLEGRDMSDYTDPAGNRLVVEMTRVARDAGAGFLEYIWQWKDNPDRVGAKLSNVKKHTPWQWVVGTGIYLEDVAVEVAAIRRQLALVSLGILAVIVVLLSYVIRQSFLINSECRRALDVLRASEESYRSVMMAVPDPVVVYDIEGRVQYINPAFSRFFGWNLDELAGQRIDFVPDACREDTLAKIKETIDHGFCTEALFSHGLCPDRTHELYKDQAWYKKKHGRK